MYCPRCAVQNLDDAKFCRACGADIRLVPQALMGSLPASLLEADRDAAGAVKKEKHRKPATLDEGLKNIFKGIAFLCIFIIGLMTFRGAFWFTIWFVIPGLGSIGEGIGQIIRARQEQLPMPPVYESGNMRPASFAPASNFTQLAAPDTAKIVNAPASVTEMTTRHLDASRQKGIAKDG